MLAKAVYQYQMSWLTYRIREQARSHIGFVVFTKLVSNPRTTLLPNAPAWRKAMPTQQTSPATKLSRKKFHQAWKP